MSKSPRVVGVITNNQHEVFQTNVIAGIVSVIKPQSYEILIHELAANAHWKTLLETISGLIVIANVLDDESLNSIYQSAIPLTLVSHQVAGLSIPSVVPDNEQGIECLVKYLVEVCRRSRFVYIRGDMEQLDAQSREKTFRRELLRYNLNVPEAYFLRGDFSADVAAESVKRFIHQAHQFDAIVAADYLMGVTTIRELRACGMSVPDDVAVVAFGDGPEAAVAGLTTVAAHVVEQGQRAGRQLIGQMQGLFIRGSTVMRTELIERDTGRILKNNLH